VTAPAAPAATPVTEQAPAVAAASSAPASVAVSISKSPGEDSPDGAVSAAQAQDESKVDASAVVDSGPRPEPVSKSQAEAVGPALGPSAPPVENTDPTDYSVRPDGSVVVAAGETLEQYARWLRVRVAHLRQLNHQRKGRQVALGHHVKLDFARVSREQFEHRRREYHRQIQAAYFATHRISGTQVYISRSGDSLWGLTRRFDDIPEWLLMQYNPDVRFDELQPRTQITVPLIKAL
jgi:membrane-bound lytic murein transglycosylase D